jgi:hypothetical protein
VLSPVTGLLATVALKKLASQELDTSAAWIASLRSQ